MENTVSVTVTQTKASRLMYDLKASLYFKEFRESYYMYDGVNVLERLKSRLILKTRIRNRVSYRLMFGDFWNKWFKHLFKRNHF